MSLVSLARRLGPVEAPWEALRIWRAEARALAGATADAERVALARAFGRCAVQAWWRAIMGAGQGAPPPRAALQPFESTQLDAASRRLAETIGATAAEIDDEMAFHEIGLVYTGMLPPDVRGRLGAYYTPPALAARLIDQASEAGADWASARVLDPACGGGAFLAPVAQRMIAALADRPPGAVIASLAARLRGWEIDPFAAWFSQVALDAALAPIARAAGVSAPALVEVRDSLAEVGENACFDLVIGNPPYGRVTLGVAERLRYRRSLFGHANLYGLFTDMALRRCTHGGLVAYVTPTSFLAGEYFKKLRSLHGREAPPVAIDFVAARKGVFDDVLQETLLATYRRGSACRPIAIRVITVADGGSLEASTVGTARLPADPSQPWILPRDPGHAPLVARLATMKSRLKDWGWTVSTGPLVWNRHKDQLAHSPGRDRRPLIWAESVTPDGRFEFRAERRGHASYFSCRRGDEWLVTGKPCVLIQRTTAKEQRRRLIAAALPESFLAEHGAVVIENHLNMLRPTGKPAVSAAVLAAFLNSAAADRAFRCVSGSVAVSAYELEALPLPAPEALADLRGLVDEGADRPCIEVVCAGLYGDAC